MAFQPPARNDIDNLRNMDILVDILRFVEANRSKISFLAEQKGGWEGWLQAELAWHLETSTDYMIDREEAVFNASSQHIDLWCNPRVQNPPTRHFDFGKIGVELKCEGMWQDTVVKGEKFRARVMADVAKVEAGIDPRRGPCHVYVVGVTTEKDDIERFKFDHNPVKGFPVFDYWASSPASGRTSEPAFYVFWWQAYFSG